jgi:hypothetical protein
VGPHLTEVHPYAGVDARSMREAEEGLGVVVEYLVEVGRGQAEPADVGEGLLVGLVILQHGVVAAGHQVARAEGFVGAHEGRSTPCRNRSPLR